MSTPTRPATAPPLTTGLSALVDAIRRSVRQGLPAGTTADLVAANLGVALRQPDLVPEVYRQADPECYTQHVIHCEPDGSFSLVALVWLPGQCTPVHDHVSWCVTGVYEGEEHEQRYALRGEGDGAQLVPAGEDTNQVGDVCALTPPGDIHRVRNGGEDLAISLHVYGADISVLGNSVRRTYELPVAG